LERFVREGFEFMRGEIFFAELDVVHPGVNRFGDFFEQTTAAGGLVCGECSAVGNVVENAAAGRQSFVVGHQVSGSLSMDLVAWTV